MILVENKVVIAIMDSYTQESNGKLINGSIFPMGEVVEVEASVEVLPQKYCYTNERGFYLNPSYSDPATMEAEFKSLKEQISLMQLAIDEMIMGGGL